MHKSLFMKYYSVCAAMVLICIAVLGAVFLVFASRYFKMDKLRTLHVGASRAVEVIEDYDTSGGGGSDLAVSNSMRALAAAADSTIFLTDAGGHTVFCTAAAPARQYEVDVPQSILRQAQKKGIYSEMGKLGGVYEDRYYTVALPLYEGGRLSGYVLNSAHVANQQQQFLSEMLQMFLISALAVLAISFIAVYFITLRMVKPLREMSVAAQRFGRGEFDARIPVESYDEMGQLAMALNNMAQSLSTMEAARRSFTANISHELKTPMTSIAGFIDGILDGTIPPEKERYYLGIASNETKRLSRLVKTMLNLSRIEAGEMTLQKKNFNIVETICRTVFSFEQQIEKKQLDVQGLDHDKVMVEADPDLIHQVVYNLVENAVKFVNEGGYLKFTFSKDADHIFISIKNSGEGLSKEEIPKLFDRFYKTDRSRGLDKNGVGLGLYIVRSIINLHNGDIIVRSVQGEYSEFVFSLPNKKQTPRFKKS